MTLLDVDQLTSHRGEQRLFEDLSFSLGASQALQIHGPNGGGKTTLLRILCGLTLPTSGAVRWRQREVTRGTWADTAAYRAELCYLGHTNGVKAELSALENLRFWQTLYEVPDPERIEAALEDVGLAGYEDTLTGSLSAGQRRRVALARLLISGAVMWILDEPFTSLDRDAIAWVQGRIESHLDTGGCVILTSHQPATLRAEVQRLELR